MIYCVVPEVLAPELFDKLVEYYKDEPGVEVIVDRRSGSDRRTGVTADEHAQRRETRDRRRVRARGSFPPIEPDA